MTPLLAPTAVRYRILTRGSYTPAVTEQAWLGFPPAVARAGDEPYTKVASNTDATVPIGVYARLGVPMETTVFERVRTQGAVVDGQAVPIQLATSWYPLDVVRLVPEIRRSPHLDPPPVRHRMIATGRLIHAESTTCGRFATGEERAQLRLPDPAVVLQTWRVWKDEQDRVVEVTRIVDDARWVEVSY